MLSVVNMGEDSARRFDVSEPAPIIAPKADDSRRKANGVVASIPSLG
jgi:hypothetical protein